MGGDNEHNSNQINLESDEPCNGAGCSCGCGCQQCFCRLDLADDNGANREGYPGEGGHDQHDGVSSLPIDIPIRLSALRLAEDSFQEEIVGPNEPTQVIGASVALTQANIHHLTNSYDESGSYQEEWLRQYRMEVDENPFPAFLSPRSASNTEMFEFEHEGMFCPIEHEGSLCVEGSVAGDNRSVTSRSSCPRSRSSRSASQLLSHMEPTPGFIHRPLPLLGVLEFTCPKCGCEHD